MYTTVTMQIVLPSNVQVPHFISTALLQFLHQDCKHYLVKKLNFSNSQLLYGESKF